MEVDLRTVSDDDENVFRGAGVLSSQLLGRGVYQLDLRE